ncbi:UDP-N-acetylenolpyruvoylglucosamine reductase [Steroidobacter denitrificans]|uniref:UDP-N-acetylenolpyruvoylglucosamine reductase n=1 Tax=Steroidobacter denitrificans TaxID=465721 RepID=A0A127F5X6_STEDE|nr:UDP-N-acetylmuramate dehydrogenase [Steroidobacter denitrificans]AMN45842.1 UDP-N-acetylenolpyruvoylglucosamine reductase [Steroidobacter denitrificans]
MNAFVLAPDVAARVLRDEPMSRHTSWHVGGPADLFFKPLDADDLAQFLRSLTPETPILWIGLGSNLLVRDGGLRGAVIDTHGGLGGLERIGENEVWCGAGVACARLARQCIEWELGPAEFFAGIPGTLGGALAMNAGAFGGETWAHVISVATLDRQGMRRERSAGDYSVGYRHVSGPANEGFLGARLRFGRREQANQEDIRSLLARRKASQPIGTWSCGSVFTNPPGDHAARLIETAGLKGIALGGAQVSPMHANFIVNDGTASAADIERLIEHVMHVVEQRHGVKLKTEVRIVGEAARSAGPHAGQEGCV